MLALAPGAVIVNLAGNGLNGMGVALLQLGRAAQAVPFLLAALAIRAEIEDLEQQHVDLVHLAAAGLALGNSSIAARIARWPQSGLALFTNESARQASSACTALTPAGCDRSTSGLVGSSGSGARASTGWTHTCRT